jgi:large subunit ribosomal protein L13
MTKSIRDIPDTLAVKKEEQQRRCWTKRPEMVLELAVKGMLPKTKLGRAMIKKLFLYAAATHPHAAQKPEPFKF